MKGLFADITMITLKNAKFKALILCLPLLFFEAVRAREYHVWIKGNNANKGAAEAGSAILH
jgi:hypothetical protein